MTYCPFALVVLTSGHAGCELRQTLTSFRHFYFFHFLSLEFIR